MLPQLVVQCENNGDPTTVGPRATQFRWIQKEDAGDDCALWISDLPNSIKDNFESGSVSEDSWSVIQGGGVTSGCGQLSPHAHGDSLYFSGCKMRHAISKPLDLSRASKIMFVLQIGSISQTDSCNSALNQADTADRAVLLQYSVNSGISWHIIAQHQNKDFLKAQRVSYNIPLEARVKGVQLRWWQPHHGGTGKDQWALDNVEVVLVQFSVETPDCLREEAVQQSGCVGPNASGLAIQDKCNSLTRK
ncbi:hypothetical protein QTP86_005865 [Hemibagrus guttatus]|nr:hypothetical protein QTP86_005865 [Hemibagrus guttatus]